jgi:hypothetical protein
MKNTLPVAVLTSLILSVTSPFALAQSAPERAVKKEFNIRGNVRKVTVDLRPSDTLAKAVCGKQLFFAKGGDWIRFDCDGGGEFYNATGVPPNGGKLEWGFRISDDDKSSLVIKSFRDVGFGTIDKPTAAIMYRFTEGIDGTDKSTVWGGALGEWTDGRVLLIFGHVPTAGGSYISK